MSLFGAFWGLGHDNTSSVTSKNFCDKLYKKIER
jgi:hypothetical protein